MTSYILLRTGFCLHCRKHNNLHVRGSKCLYEPTCVLRGPPKPDYDWHACDVHYPLFEDD